MIIYFQDTEMEPGARFTKDPKSFWARKPFVKNINNSFYKAGWYFSWSLRQEMFNLKQSFMLRNLFTRYSVNYRARNRPEKFRGFGDKRIDSLFLYNRGNCAYTGASKSSYPKKASSSAILPSQDSFVLPSSASEE